MNLLIKDFPDELAKQLRIEAIKRNHRIKQIVEDAIRKEITGGDANSETALVVADRTSVVLRRRQGTGEKGKGNEVIATRSKDAEISASPVNRCQHRVASVCDECQKHQTSNKS
jgi:plasmid stability protein